MNDLALPLAERCRIAARLRAERDAIARRLAFDAANGHDTHGALAQSAHHLDVLAAALETGSTAAFAASVAQAAAMLAARGIPAAAVASQFGRLADALRAVLGDDAAAPLVLLDAGRRALDTPPRGDVADATFVEARDEYLVAALAADRRGALSVVTRALDVAPAVAVYPGVLQAAMVEVGARWARGTLTVAQEHLVTSITQYVLAGAYPRLPRPTAERGRALVTGVAGERHQLGAHLVSDVLEAAGWSVRFLGSDVPDRDVVDAARTHRAHVVGLSATLLTAIPAARMLVARLRAELPPATRIVVGGEAFRYAPELALELGADACALDLRSALAVMEAYAPA